MFAYGIVPEGTAMPTDPIPKSHMRPVRRSLVLFTAMATLAFASCTENVTNPPVGSGEELEATVNGTAISLDLLGSTDFNIYTASSQEVRIGGSLVGSPTRTITLRFTHDIDNGHLPHTMSGDDISINYIESGATTLTYDCPVGSTCSITVTASNGQTVAGTFSATLAERSDPTKTVTITNGTFSVKLARR